MLYYLYLSPKGRKEVIHTNEKSNQNFGFIIGFFNTKRIWYISQKALGSDLVPFLCYSTNENLTKILQLLNIL